MVLAYQHQANRHRITAGAAAQSQNEAKVALAAVELGTGRHKRITLKNQTTEVNILYGAYKRRRPAQGKRVEIGLTYIYGIGRSTAQNILRETGVNPDIRVKDLSESDVNKLREYIDHHCKVEGDLRREVSMNIKEAHRSRLLSRRSSPQGLARSRSEHEAERTHHWGQAFRR